MSTGQGASWTDSGPWHPGGEGGDRERRPPRWPTLQRINSTWCSQETSIGEGGHPVVCSYLGPRLPVTPEAGPGEGR